MIRISRPHVRAVLGGAAAGALAATLLVATSTQSQAAGLLTIPVNCSDGATLTIDNASYELHGTCGVVKIKASNTTVTMPATTKLIVHGSANTVHSKPISQLRVLGHDQRIVVDSVRRARISSPGSLVRVRGLLERAGLNGNHATLKADRITTAVVRGNRNVLTARAGKGYLARVPGDHNQLTWRRLEQLRVGGDRNDVTVHRGTTELRVSGSGNHFRLNHRA